MRALAKDERPVWSQMTFSAAEENLHAGARDGIDARVYWPGVGEVPVAELVLRRLLPLAHAGLEGRGVEASDRERLLGHHRAPLRGAANGATWQAPPSTASTTTAGSSAPTPCASSPCAIAIRCTPTSPCTPGRALTRARGARCG